MTYPSSLLGAPTEQKRSLVETSEFAMQAESESAAGSPPSRSTFHTNTGMHAIHPLTNPVLCLNLPLLAAEGHFRRTPGALARLALVLCFCLRCTREQCRPCSAAERPARQALMRSSSAARRRVSANAERRRGQPAARPCTASPPPRHLPHAGEVGELKAELASTDLHVKKDAVKKVSVAPGPCTVAPGSPGLGGWSGIDAASRPFALHQHVVRFDAATGDCRTDSRKGHVGGIHGCPELH